MIKWFIVMGIHNDPLRGQALGIELVTNKSMNESYMRVVVSATLNCTELVLMHSARKRCTSVMRIAHQRIGDAQRLLQTCDARIPNIRLVLPRSSAFRDM